MKCNCPLRISDNLMRLLRSQAAIIPEGDLDSPGWSRAKASGCGWGPLLLPQRQQGTPAVSRYQPHACSLAYSNISLHNNANNWLSFPSGGAGGGRWPVGPVVAGGPWGRWWPVARGAGGWWPVVADGWWLVRPLVAGRWLGEGGSGWWVCGLLWLGLAGMRAVNC
jgi:hypothetical protein